MNIFTVCISLTSLFVAIASLILSKQVLSQAKQVADRDLRDWRQMKWFDLYLNASAVVCEIDAFQAKYVGTTLQSASINGQELEDDWKRLFYGIRRTQAMAAVFPVTPAVTDFLQATVLSTNQETAYKKALTPEYKNSVFDAVDSLRMKALVDPAILLPQA